RDQELTEARGQLDQLRQRVARYTNLERAVPVMTERAEAYAEALRGQVEAANAQMAQIGAQMSHLTALRGRLLEHADIFRHAIAEIAPPDDDSLAPVDTPEVPDLRSILDEAWTAANAEMGLPVEAEAEAVDIDTDAEAEVVEVVEAPVVIGEVGGEIEAEL